MADEAPNSSWHPAFMPNRIDEDKESKPPGAGLETHDIQRPYHLISAHAISEAVHGESELNGNTKKDDAEVKLRSEEPAMQTTDSYATWQPALVPDRLSKNQEPEQAATIETHDIQEPHHLVSTHAISEAVHGDSEFNEDKKEDDAEVELKSEEPAVRTTDSYATWQPALVPDRLSKNPESEQAAVIETHDIQEPHHLVSTHAIPEAAHDDSGFNGDQSKDDAEVGFMPQEPVRQTIDTHATEVQPQHPQEEPRQPPSQHASSMSFARTVSHEISFNDEDEGDWTLSRSDTDPFKFMPPSNRTNSFPAVPPQPMTEESLPSHPLPPTQALDIVEEVDQTSLSEEPQEAASLWPMDGAVEPGTAEDFFQTIGGELGDDATEASQSKFEEGLPLIPAVAESSESTTQPAQNSPLNTFDDDGTGDDFFSQIRSDQPSDDFIQPVQRKSTMQVIGNTLADHQQSGFDVVDEHDDEDEHAKALATAFDVASSSEIPQDPAAELSAKWQEAFATSDDDDFLPDVAASQGDEFDAAGFLGSDDEGLLDDDDEAPLTPAISVPAPNSYLPAQNHTMQKPSTAPPSTYGSLPQPPQQTPYGGSFNYAPASQTRPQIPKTESFADKSKGGYSSPYDLPTDFVSPIVKPRKRPSLPQMAQQPVPPPMAPHRSSSAYTPVSGATASSPAIASGPVTQAPPRSASRQEGFFEDLPITSKPRPASRQSLGAAASPSALYGTPSQTGAIGSPPINQQYQPAPAQAAVPPPNAGPNLVAPPRVNPYAALQSGPASPLPPASSAARYSPVSAQHGKGTSAPPPAASSRFSPAPPLPRQNSSPTHTATASASQSYRPHLPRTSSPLAQFEIHHGKSGSGSDAPQLDRRISTNHEPRLNRVASLPPTREVDEEYEEQRGQSAAAGQQANPAGMRYNPASQQQTPSAQFGHLTSPQKRTTSSYLPQTAPNQTNFAPPLRSQTQSPGATRSGHSQARPSSANATAAPAFGHAQTANALPNRNRGTSLTMNLVPPTDGHEHDPLQRWQGVPIFSWGVGGTIVTSFPKSTPRYTMNQAAPTLLRSPGEVKIKSMKEIEPLSEHLAKFPGPLKGKSKKKDAIAWLTSGIGALEQQLPDISLSPQLSLEAKRSIERLLLWKILRIFIEFDGHLEGSPLVEKAVRDVLSPQNAENAPFSSSSTLGNQSATLTGMRSDDVDPASIESIRDSLLKSDRESAVWSAVDKRLWGHAMLIAHTTSSELYSRVAQEFVRKEVNYPGHNNESLGAFYKILSGNFEDCVDELVPVHARAGLQLMSPETGLGPTQDATGGLDKWVETVSMVLSNRSENDIRGLNALGKLLSGYGRAEAAQICFIFSRSISVFGGIDDPQVDFVLVGADHRQQSDQFAKETEALQLSEIYEFGLMLSGAANLAAGAPHLAGYKLQLATALAEHGCRDKALQYCDAILSSMSAQTRRSTYHHVVLETAVDDFMRRLKQAPKDDGSSWMSKPSMNKVSDSVWNRFNKFVSGDEDAGGSGGADGEHGPFARISSTPNISRSPSVSNFETYGTSPSYGAPPMNLPSASAATSRYAPVATPAAAAAPSPYEFASQQPVAPQQQMNGRASKEYFPNPYGPANSNYKPGGYEPTYSQGLPGASPYQPQAPSTTAQQYGLQPSPSIATETNAGTNQEYRPTSYEPSVPVGAAAEGAKSTEATQSSYQPPSTQTYGYDSPSSLSYGYEPLGMQSQNHAVPSTESQGYEPPSAQSQGYEPPSAQSQGYEPPTTQSYGYEPPTAQSYGYEPPSYQPGPNHDADDDAPKPKKKSFMDDDEDDISANKPAGKSKADLDRENEDMFKKVAEEEAKRAAEAARAKKSGGWGFGGWFGGSKKSGDLGSSEAAPQKAIKAKLGESNSFVYDPDLKRWINKKPGAEQTEAPKATPPPPRGSAPRSASGTPLLAGRAGPPMGLGRPASTSNLKSEEVPAPGGLGISTPPMTRTDSQASMPTGGRPPSRPTTSISHASSIDDLIGAAGPRKAGAKKPRKGGRYVDVMAK